MNFQTLMQAGPAKANELFARLAETSAGAVKTREKLFTELKNELELHTSLEGQHLFPILRRNPETKELVAEAVKDNKELRRNLMNSRVSRRAMRLSTNGSKNCKRPSASMPGTKSASCYRR